MDMRFYSIVFIFNLFSVTSPDSTQKRLDSELFHYTWALHVCRELNDFDRDLTGLCYGYVVLIKYIIIFDILLF